MTELSTVDMLIIDDFALESMTRDESRDMYQLFVERTASTVVTSNRDTAEWLATFDDMNHSTGLAPRLSPSLSASKKRRRTWIMRPKRRYGGMTMRPPSSLL